MTHSCIMFHILLSMCDAFSSSVRAVARRSDVASTTYTKHPNHPRPVSRGKAVMRTSPLGRLTCIANDGGNFLAASRTGRGLVPSPQSIMIEFVAMHGCGWWLHEGTRSPPMSPFCPAHVGDGLFAPTAFYNPNTAKFCTCNNETKNYWQSNFFLLDYHFHQVLVSGVSLGASPLSAFLFLSLQFKMLGSVLEEYLFFGCRCDEQCRGQGTWCCIGAGTTVKTPTNHT